MSAAFERMPRPDWAATTTIVVPDAGRLTSRQWAEAIFDVRALTDDQAARRVNLASPDDSLMLLKPSGAVPHVGGQA